MKINILSKEIEIPQDSSSLSIAQLVIDSIKKSIKEEPSFNFFSKNISYDNHENQSCLIASIKAAKSYFKNNSSNNYSKSDLIDRVSLEYKEIYDNYFLNYSDISSYIKRKFGDISEIKDSLISDMVKSQSKLNSLGVEPKQVIDKICEINGTENEDIEDALFDIYFNEVRSNDLSNVGDVLKLFGEIPVVCTPFSWGHTDSISLYDADNNLNLIPYPNERFLDFLRILNVEPISFVNSVDSNFDINLLSSIDDDDFDSEWAVLCNKNPLSLGINVKAKEVLFSDDILSVLNNSESESVSPVIYLAVSANQLLDFDASTDLIVNNGQVGVHDFTSGTGSLRSFSTPMILPGDLDNWSHAYSSDSIGDPLNLHELEDKDQSIADISFLPKKSKNLDNEGFSM